MCLKSFSFSFIFQVPWKLFVKNLLIFFSRDFNSKPDCFKLKILNWTCNELPLSAIQRFIGNLKSFWEKMKRTIKITEKKSIFQKPDFIPENIIYRFCDRKKSEARLKRHLFLRKRVFPLGISRLHIKI